MNTYQDALAKFNTARNKSDGKPLASNKRLYQRSDGSIEVVLYNTSIVVLHPDNTLTLNTGGWNTITTRKHINKHLPDGVYLFSRNWELQLGRALNANDWSRRAVIKFKDGIRIDSKGRLVL